eukprot:TRINITY_DN27518_c0_g1_i1.p1 TRINITY_DN27518_c0_g1~~TRINITY_DN27518_c0_g1_i1.p1  ORF type:complete len:139 (+),score=6.92 TRINITY_DN27518_c0_g1_i1:141-557(+)
MRRRPNRVSWASIPKDALIAVPEFHFGGSLGCVREHNEKWTPPTDYNEQNRSPNPPRSHPPTSCRTLSLSGLASNTYAHTALPRYYLSFHFFCVIFIFLFSFVLRAPGSGVFLFENNKTHQQITSWHCKDNVQGSHDC